MVLVAPFGEEGGSLKRVYDVGANYEVGSLNGEAVNIN